MKGSFVALGVGFTTLLTIAAVAAHARPGGGNSYSGGSSSSSSSSRSGRSSSDRSSSDRSPARSWAPGPSAGSNGPGDNFGKVLGGVFIGFVVVVLILVPFAQKEPEKKRRVDVGGHLSPPPPEPSPRDRALALVRRHDPDFSLVLFEDFAYALYAESQLARHDAKALAALSPYWADAELTALAARPPQGGRVVAVVVGSLGPKRATEADSRLQIRCSFETNLHIELETQAQVGVLSSLLVKTGLVTAPPVEKRALTHYAQETWTFTRNVDARTKPWTGLRRLGCPNCGAPLHTGGDARCPACGEASGAGRFDWQVTSLDLHRAEAREHSLTGTSEEVGTSAPTRFAVRAREALEALLLADPSLTAESMVARIRLIFDMLQSTWAAQDLRPLRPFVSDRQYDYLQYWIEAYQEKGLRNLMDRPFLEEVAFARVERDAHYDAITVRVWATGHDYTVDSNSGQVVGGSRTVPRRYSEYWTLIRSAKAHGAPRLDNSCPGCGVSLAVNMAGECEHCRAHVTSGEFDWVLSKIEQDEAYQG